MDTKRVITTMFEKVTVRIFLICLAGCASLVLSFIWGGGPDTPASAVYFKIAATFFVAGLASFLLWLITFLHKLRDRLRA